MDNLYSLSLLVSLIAGSLGVIMGAIAAFSNGPKKTVLRIGLASTLSGMAALAVSVLVHRYWGHGPGSLEPMAWGAFLEFHTAFTVAGVLLAAGLAVYWYAQTRTGALVLALLLVMPAISARAGQFEILTQAYPPWLCRNCAEWNVPHEPFRIHGNSHYVGTEGLSAILITSPEGHVLIDGALPESAPLILENIRTLGFEPADIELILNSHVHYDHAGGIAAIQHVSGARVAASPESANVLERGRSGPDDPQYATLLGIPPVADVERFEPGDTLRVGPIEVTAHATPGHSPGGTSWSWRACENTDCLDLVYADSLAPISADGYRFSDWPEALAEYKRGFARLEALSCDILVTTHPVSSSMWSRLESGPRGLVDPQACKDYAENARRELAQRISREQEIQHD